MNKLLIVIFAFVFQYTYADKQNCGTVVSLKGDISYLQNGTKTWTKLVENSSVCEGDSLKSKKKSKAKIRFPNGNSLRIGQNTKIKLSKNQMKKGEKKTLINLFYGKLRNDVKVKYKEQGEYYQVKTKSVVAGVRGTNFLVEYDTKSNDSSVVTFEGTVEAFPRDSSGKNGPAILVRSGHKLDLKSGAKSRKAIKLPMDTLKSLDQANSQEGDLAPPPPPRNLRQQFEQRQQLEGMKAPPKQTGEAMKERSESQLKPPPPKDGQRLPPPPKKKPRSGDQ